MSFPTLDMFLNSKAPIRLVQINVLIFLNFPEKIIENPNLDECTYQINLQQLFIDAF